MSKPLVIVESPAKAKTIASFLGSEYDVRASVGHVADLPSHRVVFHEITKAAISHAFATPRDLDFGLVDAAETRRILDRLFGYEVSPVLWRKVNRGLSAGRVQSPTVRLIVERERERIAFVTAGYWGLDLVSATSPSFKAALLELDGSRVATGKDFDSTGRVKDGVVVLSEAAAHSLVARLADAPVTVRSVEDKPYRSSPKAPRRVDANCACRPSRSCERPRVCTSGDSLLICEPTRSPWPTRPSTPYGARFAVNSARITCPPPLAGTPTR